MATETAIDSMMLETPQSATVPASSASNSKPERLPTTVSKPIPYTYTLSHLLANDPNPLPPTSTLLKDSASTNALLKSIARDGAQSLINTLLTTCPIISTPDGPSINLTSSTAPDQIPFPLPRRLPLPKPKVPTKWENFARKKGIGKFGGNASGGAVLQERRKNMVYDEESGEWVKKWGYKGKNKAGEGSDWLVELDDKKVRTEKGLDQEKTIRGEGKRERMERVRRQDRKERNNAKRGGNRGGAG